jgi:Ricin-type beta-trefoil lectin domain
MRNGFWRLLAIVTFAWGLTSVSARADDGFYTFASALSPPSNSFCIDVPNADYQPGKRVSLFGCARTPNQTFQLANGSNLTAGGLCLDGLAANRGQPPGAGDPVVLAECDGSDHQVWELEPFPSNASLFSIVDPGGLCVTVDGPNAAPGTPLVLAQCAELQNQGWIEGGAPRPFPVRAQGGVYVGGYAEYPEPEYYWYTGHRYCWYDGGWHGPGWYWCGENFHNGFGWGGPVGWHFWFHFGHKWLNHPVLFAAHHGMPPHRHDVSVVAVKTGLGGNLGGKGNQGRRGNQGAQGGQGIGGQGAVGQGDKGDKKHDTGKLDTGKLVTGKGDSKSGFTRGTDRIGIGGGGSGKIVSTHVNTNVSSRVNVSSHVNTGIKVGGGGGGGGGGNRGANDKGKRHP